MKKGFSLYHPVVNAVFYISVIVFGMIINHPVCIFISVVSSFLFHINLFGKKGVKSFFTFLLPMAFVITVINALFAHYGVTKLFTLPGGNSLTLEATVYGAVTGFTILSVIQWFFTYNEVVTTDKFMFIFGRFLPNVMLVISMALRFIPIYKIKLQEIANAQRGIGKDYRQGNVIKRIKNGSEIIVILVTWALENAIETADSMRARGYGKKKRKVYSYFEWEAKDKTALIFIILVDIILIFVMFTKSLKCTYNPIIAIPELNFLSAAGILSYILLNFLPIFINIREERKWHSLKSKI